MRAVLELGGAVPLLASTASTPALSAVASRCRCFAADAKRNLQAASTAREEGLQKEGRPAGTGNDGPGGPQPTLEQQAHKAMGAAQDQLASAYAMGKVQAQVALGATLRLWDTVRSSDASRKTAAALGDAADKGLARLYEAARLLNQFTGYTEVEALKQGVTLADRELSTAKSVATYRKQVYQTALENQLKLQSTLNKLLERKGSWTDEDVSKFAALCRDEGKVNNEVQEARIAHEDSVTSVERAQEEYMQAMRERYTAEQLWGDKIRRAATWYTWGLMGLQLISFVAVVMVVEPRRVQVLHDRVKALLEEKEGKTAEQVEARLSTKLEDIHRAVEESRVNVLHLDAAGNATQRADGPQTDGPVTPEVAKMMTAVVAFMDGVHAELVQQRHALSRLEKRTTENLQLQPAMATHTQQQEPHDTHSTQRPAVASGTQGAGTSGHEHMQLVGAGVGAAVGGHEAGLMGHEGEQVGLLGGRTAAWLQTLERVGIKVDRSEHLLGTTAAVSACVGALVGVALATFFARR